MNKKPKIMYQATNFETDSSTGLRKFIQPFRINRKHKDQLFLRLFQDKGALLSLYNALNASDYTNPKDLIITTIDDVVYIGMKNDCSFIIGNHLNLYEHQSTFCPNMPIRGLLYLSSIYQAYVTQNHYNLYGSRLIPLPAPQYVIFYNGTDEFPDKMFLRLTDAFSSSDSCLEFTATMLNINPGHNPALMEHCKLLKEYSEFIDLIRRYRRMGYSQTRAADAACEYAIEHDILRNFLLKHRSEVKYLIPIFYDEKYQRKLMIRDLKEDAREEGLREGLRQGRQNDICNSIKICKNCQISYDITKANLISHYSLSNDEAEHYLMKYW